ncbi:hypothetical protein CC86DRAFT_37196 [Ophiobolus disseminans]|uniref:Uncharacterized protein n=1 Tax=Ophiobolus disseminans TaxID=1469910 RepID=A0A6A6ZYM7_9PLEO|nr:hypothetical protein CC86DRAFT_37196 [Ophiobolus disseminans]
MEEDSDNESPYSMPLKNEDPNDLQPCFAPEPLAPNTLAPPSTPATHTLAPPSTPATNTLAPPSTAATSTSTEISSAYADRCCQCLLYKQRCYKWENNNTRFKVAGNKDSCLHCSNRNTACNENEQEKAAMLKRCHECVIDERTFWQCNGVPCTLCRLLNRWCRTRVHREMGQRRFT